MTKKCCICQSNKQQTYHRFPKSPEFLNLWKQVCNFETYDNVSNLLVCSQHFNLEDYKEPNSRNLGIRLLLKPGRIPSVNVPNKIEILESHIVPLEVSLGAIKNTEKDEVAQTVQNTEKNEVPQIVQNIEINEVPQTVQNTEKNEVPQTVKNTENNEVPQTVKNTENNEVPQTVNNTEMNEIPQSKDNNAEEQLLLSSSEDGIELQSKDCEDVTQTPKKRKYKEPRFFSEVLPSDMNDPRLARIALYLAKTKIDSLTIKNQNLLKENRILTKKLKLLEDKI